MDYSESIVCEWNMRVVEIQHKQTECRTYEWDNSTKKAPKGASSRPDLDERALNHDEEAQVH